MENFPKCIEKINGYDSYPSSYLQRKIILSRNLISFSVTETAATAAAAIITIIISTISIIN